MDLSAQVCVKPRLEVRLRAPSRSRGAVGAVVVRPTEGPRVSERAIAARSHRIGLGTLSLHSPSFRLSSAAFLGASKEVSALPLSLSVKILQLRSPLAAAPPSSPSSSSRSDCGALDFRSIPRSQLVRFLLGRATKPTVEAVAAFARTKLRVYPAGQPRLSYSVYMVGPDFADAAILRLSRSQTT